MTTPAQILQVRYRNPRNTMKIFWAEDAFDVGTGFRFTGCRIMRIATIYNTGMFKNYRERLGSITIPNSLTPTSREVALPEWWSRTLKDAEAELKRLTMDPIGTDGDNLIRPFTRDLCEWLRRSIPREE